MYRLSLYPAAVYVSAARLCCSPLPRWTSYDEKMKITDWHRSVSSWEVSFKDWLGNVLPFPKPLSLPQVVSHTPQGRRYFLVVHFHRHTWWSWMVYWAKRALFLPEMMCYIVIGWGVHLIISYYYASTAESLWIVLSCNLQPVAPSSSLSGATGLMLPQFSSWGGFLLFPKAIPSVRTFILGSVLHVPICRNCPTAHCWLRRLSWAHTEGLWGWDDAPLRFGGNVSAQIYPEDELGEGW